MSQLTLKSAPMALRLEALSGLCRAPVLVTTWGWLTAMAANRLSRSATSSCFDEISSKLASSVKYHKQNIIS